MESVILQISATLVKGKARIQFSASKVGCNSVYKGQGHEGCNSEYQGKDVLVYIKGRM